MFAAVAAHDRDVAVDGVQVTLLFPFLFFCLTCLFSLDPCPHAKDTTAETTEPGIGETAAMRPERLGGSVAPSSDSV